MKEHDGSATCNAEAALANATLMDLAAPEMRHLIDMRYEP
jgi:hypothetical protein